MSISNFYFFGTHLLCNKTKDDGTITRGRRRKGANIIDKCTNFSIPKGLTPFELVGSSAYGVERLLISKDNDKELLKIYIEGIPVEVEFVRIGSEYTVSSPDVSKIGGTRMNELAMLTSPEGISTLPEDMRVVSVAYLNLLHGNMLETPVLGDATMLMTHLSGIIDKIRKVTYTNPTKITIGGVPIVKYSEKDFSRLIMLTVSLSGMLSGGRILETRCNAGLHMACFEAVFEPDIPCGLMEQLICGRFEEHSFTGEYGNIFMTACYLRHLARGYGYSFTVEQNGGVAVLTVAFPLVKAAEAAMVFRELRDKVWIEEMAVALIRQPAE